MLLFERNGQQRFFSCSAYRDRKLCSAYLSETEWEGSKKNSLLSQSGIILETSQRLDVIRRNILPQVRILPECKRNYCKKCGELFVDSGNHKGHDIIRGISDNLLNSPPKVRNITLHHNFDVINLYLFQFLPPLDHSKKEAQFFFSEATIQLILSLLREINANNLLCIACPTIYDEVKRNHSSNCLMLDLDVRFVSC